MLSAPRILLTRRWPAAAERAFSDRYQVSFNPTDAPLSRAALADAVRSFDVICPTLGDVFAADMLDPGPLAVKLLSNYGAGVDHIALEACGRHGIMVSNTPDVLTDATAEVAILLMLMVARRAGEGERSVRDGTWRGWSPTCMMGHQLTGRTLGLVGFGRIAQVTGRMARSLGMRVAYFARRRADPAVEATAEAMFLPALASLLSVSDVVSLHVPGGADTHHLMDAQALAAMRPGAYLINTARGSVIDEPALAAALHAGTIGGAALDVFVGEPRLCPELLAAPNVVVLPHLGSATVETRTAMGLRAVANVDAWVSGLPLPDRVV